MTDPLIDPSTLTEQQREAIKKEERNGEGQGGWGWLSRLF